MSGSRIRGLTQFNPDGLNGSIESNGDTLSSLKHNRAASAAPTSGDNFAHGYAIGSTWFYGTRKYICHGDGQWSEIFSSSNQIPSESLPPGSGGGAQVLADLDDVDDTVNPAQGDLLVRHNDIWINLPKGPSGTVLTSGSLNPVWLPPSGGSGGGGSGPGAAAATVVYAAESPGEEWLPADGTAYEVEAYPELAAALGRVLNRWRDAWRPNKWAEEGGSFRSASWDPIGKGSWRGQVSSYIEFTPDSDSDLSSMTVGRYDHEGESQGNFASPINGACVLGDLITVVLVNAVYFAHVDGSAGFGPSKASLRPVLPSVSFGFNANDWAHDGASKLVAVGPSGNACLVTGLDNVGLNVLGPPHVSGQLGRPTLPDLDVQAISGPWASALLYSVCHGHAGWLVATSNGMYRSVDGLTWARVPDPPASNWATSNYHRMARYAPINGAYILESKYGTNLNRIAYSYDGVSWANFAFVTTTNGTLTDICEDAEGRIWGVIKSARTELVLISLENHSVQGVQIGNYVSTTIFARQGYQLTVHKANITARMADLRDYNPATHFAVPDLPPQAGLTPYILTSNLGGGGGGSSGSGDPPGSGDLTCCDEIVHEFLYGVQDGVNKVFETSNDVFIGSEWVRANGILQIRDRDYTFTASDQITFDEPPDDWWALEIKYKRS